MILLRRATGVAFIFPALALAIGAEACRGEEAGVPTLPPLVPTDSFPLVGETTPCGGEPDMTIAKLRPKLSMPGSYAFVLTYQDGRTTPASVTIGAYSDVVRCRTSEGGGPGLSGVAPTYIVTFTTTLSIATDDGQLLGTLPATFTFDWDEGPFLAAEAEFSGLQGTLRPTLTETEDAVRSVLVSEPKTDTTHEGAPLVELDVSEMAYMTHDRQDGAPIGVLGRKSDRIDRRAVP
jgi:hypothetical protein